MEKSIMTRLAHLDRATLSADAQRVWDKISGRRGDVRGPYQILMHAPELAEKVAALGEFIRFTGNLPGKDRELAILATARFSGVAFEWVMHEPFARKEGVSCETVEMLRSLESLDIPDPRERLIVQVVKALRDSQALPDDLYERAKDELGASHLVELVAVVGFYKMIALVLTAFEVDLPNGAAQPF
jgi:4-carboxymuconolactone decarboxylase